MKFLMSKQLCAPKTPHDIHKELVKHPDLGRCKYELLGPENKYRDENYKIYLMKCEEFKMKGKMLRDANIKALSNIRPKLGEMYKIALEEEDFENINDAEQKEETKKTTSEASVTSSLAEIRETGVKLRKRHERYYNDTWDINDKQCYNEPWFRRYLILCRFINAVRKVIIRDRLLKRLAKLHQFRKDLKLNKDLIAEYESQYIQCEHLSYPNLFEKFVK